METKGRLHGIFPTKQISERFRKREFVLILEEGSRYPQSVIFQSTGDRCDMIDAYRVGEEIAVKFDIRGREWTSPRGEVRHFVSLEVWSIEIVGERVAEPPPSPETPPPGYADDADLPF